MQSLRCNKKEKKKNVRCLKQKVCCDITPYCRWQWSILCDFVFTQSLTALRFKEQQFKGAPTVKTASVAPRVAKREDNAMAGNTGNNLAGKAQTSSARRFCRLRMARAPLFMFIFTMTVRISQFLDSLSVNHESWFSASCEWKAHTRTM